MRRGRRDEEVDLADLPPVPTETLERRYGEDVVREQPPMGRRAEMIALAGMLLSVLSFGLWAGGRIEAFRCGERTQASAGMNFTLPWEPTRLLKSPVAAEPVTVTVTAYSSTPDQTDASPWVGACGRVGPGTVALSRDLFKRYGCGARVVIAGREYVVGDTMAAQWRLRADVWMPSRGEAIRYGVRQAVLEVR